MPAESWDGEVRILRRAAFPLAVSLAYRLQRLMNPQPDPECDAQGHPRRGSAWPRRLSILSYLVSCWWFLRRHRADINLLHAHTAEWVAGFAAWAGSRLDLPVVAKEAMLPVLPAMEAEVPFRRCWEKYRRRAVFFAMTSAIADALQREGVDRRRIALVPNGVELPPEQSDVAGNRDVLMVANFSQGFAHKGFDLLIEAWSQVWRDGAGFRLVLAGGGDAQPWVLRARELGCAESVAFTGFQEELAATYARTAFFVLPSRKEGMSNALLEAMSWGIPAVVSNIPGNLAVVRPGQEGLVVEAGDSSSLAMALRRMCNDPALRVAMGRAARARIAENFSMERVADAALSAYREICSP